MFVVTQIGAFSFVAIVVAMLSLFLEFCFWEGNIFHPYYAFIEKHLHDKFWFKPLGGCVVCMNVWLCLLSFPFVAVLLGVSWWFYLPYILFSNTVLRLLIRWVD